jgi:hypothetical protein
MDQKNSGLSRRQSMQLMLGITALGLSLGKRTVDAKEVSNKIKMEGLNSSERSIYMKLSKQEQSLFIKLNASERSQFIKLDGVTEKSNFLKLNAD